MLGLPTLLDEYFEEKTKDEGWTGPWSGNAIAICAPDSPQTELKDGCLIIHISKEMEELLK